MTTATTDIAPNVKPGKKKKRLPELFRKNLVAGLDLVVDDVVEGVGGKHSDSKYLLVKNEEGYEVKRGQK